MPEGDGPAVDVDAVVIDVEGLHEAQHHRGERFVHLEEVDVANAHPGGGEYPLRRRDRAGQHDRRVRADPGAGADAGARREAVPVAEGARADEDGGGAIDDARGIAGMVDMGDPLEMGVFQQRHRVEARHRLADVAEGGLERPEAGHVGAGPRMLVLREQRQAVDVGDGHDRAREPVVGNGGGGTRLALDGKGVDIRAAEAEFGRDDVGRDALRHEEGAERQRRVDGDGRPVRAHGDAAHHLDAAGDDGLCPGGDPRGGKVHGLQPAGAEAVDGEARDAFRQVREQDGGAGEAAALFADLGHVAPDHVLGGVGRPAGAGAQGVQHVGREAQRGHFVQRAIGPSLAAGGPDGVVDIGVDH